MSTTYRMKAIEASLSTIAGVPVEVTIRGDREFTFSMDGDHRGEPLRRLLADIRASGAEATVEVADISEPGFPAFITCVYVEAGES